MNYTFKKQLDKKQLTWKRAFLLALALAVCAVGGCYGSRGVMVQGMNADLGLLPRESVISHAIHVANFSFHPLHIALVTPDCGCTKEGAQGQNVAPFGGTDILIEHMVSSENRGLQTRDIVLACEQGGKKFRLRGKVHFTLK